MGWAVARLGGHQRVRPGFLAESALEDFRRDVAVHDSRRADRRVRASRRAQHARVLGAPRQISVIVARVEQFRFASDAVCASIHYVLLVPLLRQRDEPFEAVQVQRAAPVRSLWRCRGGARLGIVIAYVVAHRLVHAVIRRLAEARGASLGISQYAHRVQCKV